MTCSLTIANKTKISFNSIPTDVADIFYNFVKKGNTNKGDLSIKLTNTYSKKLNGEYADLKTFYKENNVEPLSDKKFKHWCKTTVSVTLYDEKMNLFTANEPHNFPVVEMNMDFYRQNTDSLEDCISGLLKDYDRHSENILCTYDKEWFENDFKIEGKKINHLLMFVYSKGKQLQTELDVSYNSLSKALEGVA